MTLLTSEQIWAQVVVSAGAARIGMVRPGIAVYSQISEE